MPFDLPLTVEILLVDERVVVAAVGLTTKDDFSRSSIAKAAFFAAESIAFAAALAWFNLNSYTSLFRRSLADLSLATSSRSFVFSAIILFLSASLSLCRVLSTSYDFSRF